MSIDINEELSSDAYKYEESRLLDITNSLLRCLFFTNVNCSKNASMRDKHFFLFLIDDIYQSIAGIKTLALEGIRNSCRRELRFLLELSLNGCYIAQRYSENSIEEQVKEYEKVLKDTNVTKIRDIEFVMFNEEKKADFITSFKRWYGYTCNYVHSSRHQIEERLRLYTEGVIRQITHTTNHLYQSQ